MMAPPNVTWWTILASAGFNWSRFGPTVPWDPAAFRVWHVVQPAVRNTFLPATGSPWTVGPVVVVVVGGGAALASVFSLPRKNTEASIAITKHATTTTNHPTWRPGKFGLRPGRTNEQISANTMNA